MTSKTTAIFGIAVLAAILIVGAFGPASASLTPPTAVPGGPYSGELGSSTTFDGSASFDPDGDPLIFSWAFGDGNFGTDAFPEHTYLSVGIFDVCLTVTDPSGDADEACTTALIEDTTAPTIACPPDVELNTGEDTSPANTGTAIATDDPNPDPLPTLSDDVSQNPDGTTTIERTWTATDGSGNSSSCLQIITVLPLPVDIDIKPGSFPNSINTRSMGVVPVAILGSANFDVTQVDVTTLTFGPNSASPDHDLTDLDTYFEHLQDVNEDGFLDLVSHYKQKETGIACGDTEATLSGNLLPAFSGTPIEGTDSVNPKGC